MTARTRIQRFTLDPNQLPTLTIEEAAALDAAAIDYSDIPELPNSFWEPEGDVRGTGTGTA